MTEFQRIVNEATETDLRERLAEALRLGHALCEALDAPSATTRAGAEKRFRREAKALREWRLFEASEKED